MRVVSPLRTVPLSLLTRRTPASNVTDPNSECTGYYYAPVSQAINNFPPVWTPATLLASDTLGQAVWANISGSIPNIPPKGQIYDSTVNEADYDPNDPDCCELLFQLKRLSGG